MRWRWREFPFHHLRVEICHLGLGTSSATCAPSFTRTLTQIASKNSISTSILLHSGYLIHESNPAICCILKKNKIKSVQGVGRKHNASKHFFVFLLPRPKGVRPSASFRQHAPPSATASVCPISGYRSRERSAAFVFGALPL